MGDSIKGLVESVESSFEYAGVYGKRDEAVVACSEEGGRGLGPPDLVWLSKLARGSWATAATEPKGYWHHCLGRDVSSSAAIAAYFAELMSGQEPMTLLQGLWNSAELQVEEGVFCTYDPFSRVDVRCQMIFHKKSPGQEMMTCNAIDDLGTLFTVTPDMWRNCMVASFMRYQLLDPELTGHTPSLKRFNPVPNADAEARLLTAVLDLYRTGELPRALDFVTQDQALGCTPEHMDLVLHTLFHYFGSRHRWQAALDFFTTLSEVHLCGAVYVAAAQRELGSFADSFATLSATLELQPSNPALLLALANECVYAEEYEMAAKLARRALRQQRGLRPAWLLLARCYIRLGLYSMALITLNVVPAPPSPVPEQEMLFIVPLPEAERLTKPGVTPYDPDVQGCAQMNDEELVVDGSRALINLPAAVMVPREPPEVGAWSDLGQYRVTRTVLSAAYTLLQELVSALGWDSYLALRARVFIMSSETPAAQASKARATAVEDPPAVDGAAAHPTDAKLTAALEELAAMGMSEYPEELQEAREANARAAAAAAAAAMAVAEQKQQASGPVPPPLPPVHVLQSSASPATPAMAQSPAAGSTREAASLIAAMFTHAPPLHSEVQVAVAAEPVVGQQQDTVEHQLHQLQDQIHANHVADPLALQADEPTTEFEVPTTHEPAPGPASAGQAAVGAQPADQMEAAPIMAPVSLWSMVFGGSSSTSARPSLDAKTAQRPHGPVAEARTYSALHTTLGARLSAHTRVQTLANPWVVEGDGPQAMLGSSKRAGSRSLRRAAKAALQGVRSLLGAQQQQGTLSSSTKRVLQALQAATVGAEKSAASEQRPSHGSGTAHALICAAAGAHMRSLHATRSQSQVLPVPVAEATQQDVSDAPSPEEEERQRQEEASNKFHEARQVTAQAQMARAHAQQFQGGVQAQYQGRLARQHGLLVRTLEVDRDLALMGEAGAEEQSEEERLAKRLCVRWLDELIIALWNDLQAYMEWKAQDSELMRLRGNTMAGLVLDLPSISSSGDPVAVVVAPVEDPKSPAAQQPLAQKPAGDWMRRGMLAERLFHDEEALLSYRCCLVVGGFNMLAAMALMRLASHTGDARLALTTAALVASWHVTKMGATSTHVTCPAPLLCCVGDLAAQCPMELLQLEVVAAAGDTATAAGGKHAHGPGMWLAQALASVQAPSW